MRMLKSITLPKSFYAVALLVIVLLFLMQVKPQVDSGGVHIVEFTNAGFVPTELAIVLGDTVKFVNKSDKAFWPASDPHPMHTSYAGFDAGAAIAPSDSWTFVFSKPGVWAYHDHLSVSPRGKILVQDSGNAVLNDCKDPNDLRCFDELVVKAVREQGVDQAFALLAANYESGQYDSACHWSAHRIGEEAYRQEKTGRPLELSAQTYYCGYGFYHGYLELMLRENPDPDVQKDKVVEFCDAIQRQLGGEARDNCYHGIGSGFTEDPPDPRVWGKPLEMTKPGLAVCEQLFGHSREWEMCTTGVYAVLAKFAAANKYQFSFDPQDPFAFCRTQPELNYRACYGELAAKLEKVIGGDIGRVPGFVKDLKSQELRELVVMVGANILMQSAVLESDQTRFIGECGKLGTEYYRPCLEGVIWGFLYHGKINEEHIKAIRFCESPLFPESDRTYCYDRLVKRSKSMYSQEKFNNICSEIRKLHKEYCSI